MSQRRSSKYIAGVVAAYWIVSISMVYLNKVLMTNNQLSIPAPIFVTWSQCLFTISLCYLCGLAGEMQRQRGHGKIGFFEQFPAMTYNTLLARNVSILSIAFVGMILLNNLCLKYVEVSFYNIARSLTILFNVILSYFLLRFSISPATAFSLLIIIVGFWGGTKNEVNFSLMGTLFGVCSSLFVSFNSILTKKVLPSVDDNQWLLTFVNNINACIIFTPLMLYFETPVILDHMDKLYSPMFWVSMMLSGFLGFSIGIVTVLQIQATSPLTHNISGTAKAAVQSVMAFYIWRNPATIESLLGITLVLGGSCSYTYIAITERKNSEGQAQRNEQDSDEHEEVREAGRLLPAAEPWLSQQRCVTIRFTTSVIVSIFLTICLRVLLSDKNATGLDFSVGQKVLSHINHGSKTCSRDDFSFFHALDGCEDNMLGFGSNCTCNAGADCRFSHVREYLPPSDLYLAKFRQQSTSMCDRHLGKEIRKKVLQANIVKHRTFPQDMVDAGINTVGKDVRFNSILAYARYDPADQEPTLYDVVHPDFPWTADTPACAGNPDLKDWNCLYKSLLTLRNNDYGPPEIDAAYVYAALEARARRSNIVQVILFGLFLDLISIPSDPAREYITEHVKEINNFPDDDMLPTVGMHVRNGDSCDIPYDHEDPQLYVKYLGQHGRPCFTPPVYLKRLRELQEVYGVKKVFLATDSVDMIAAAHEAKDFNWVYLDIDRSSFTAGHQWIEKNPLMNRTVAAYSAAADFDLLARGDIFVGTFTSHYSKVGYYKMAGRLMDLPPFISLDYTACCDTLDECDAEGIDKRAYNVEGCVYRAAQCQRGYGSVNNNQDPCGIYGMSGIPLRKT